MPPKTAKEKAAERRRRKRQSAREREARRPKRKVDPAALSDPMRPEDFVLDGKKLDFKIARMITGGEIETTIEGASTLTLEMRDQDGQLKRLVNAKGLLEPAKKERGKPQKGKGKGKLSGGVLLYIGDSLGVGTVPPLKARAGYGVQSHVKGSMPSSWGEEQFNRVWKDKRFFATVFDMGTNDGNNPTELINRLKRIKNKMGNEPLIVATMNGTAAAMNTEVINYANSRADVELVTWRQYSQAHPGAMASDGIHCTGEGYKQRAGLFFDQIPKPGSGKAGSGSGRRGDELADEDLPPRLAEGSRMRAAGMIWELVRIAKQGDAFTFVFEDWAVTQLRRLNEPKKIRRDQSTRAQFIKSITAQELKEPKIKFICPELDVIIKAGQKGPPGVVESPKDERRQRGIAKDKKLNFKGKRATERQKANAEEALDQADRSDAGKRAMLAICMGGINENAFRKKLSSKEVRQAIATARTYEQQEPAEIAKSVWGKGKGALSTWRRWEKEAQRLYDAYGGAGRRRKPKLRDQDDDKPKAGKK